MGTKFDHRGLGLLDLLLPQRCVACGGGEALICPACRAELCRLTPPLCVRCGAPTRWPVDRCRECAGRRLAFASARAAVAYDGPARPLIAAWKERGVRRFAPEFGALVVETVSRPGAEALTFLPGDRDRSLKRGQNAAEALARELAALWRLPLVDILARPRPGRPQRGLARDERRRNVRHSFQAKRPSPARIALVDDVYTTGATVGAAATELRRVGARRVDVVTFARAVRR